jgi:hypothetical protein
MTTGRSTPRLEYLSACALVAVAFAWPLGASAHDDHTAAAQHHESIAKHNSQTSDFVRRVREATRRFQDPGQALQEGYLPQFGCVSGSHEGAMGVHFVNDELVGNPALLVAQPELLVYEPLSNGRLRLVAADYLVPKELWHGANGLAPPQLAGQLFHLFEFPNRFALPEFYTLHVWAWKPNPQGTFANWNPNVSCDAFEGDNP